LPRTRVAVIADSYTSSLFKLVGAEIFNADTLDAARKALQEVAKRADIGLVLIAAEYYDMLTQDIAQVEAGRSDLIIAKLPTIREKGKPMNIQRELLRALGMG